MPQVRLYVKDESTRGTGSLRHRLARSPFLHALCNGWINEQTTVIDASSRRAAVSEACFARRTLGHRQRRIARRLVPVLTAIGAHGTFRHPVGEGGATMKRLRRPLAIVLPMLGATAALAQTCPAGSTGRFVVTNSCGEPVWMVETAPGSSLTQPAVQAQWDWFAQYATERNTSQLTTGSISAGSTTLTWNSSAVPPVLPVAGVTVIVAGAGAQGGALTTTIVSANKANATLAAAASATVSNAAIRYYPGQVALLVASGASQTFCVPDKGAPGGNFRFYMGCPNNNTEPFTFPPGCTIGASAGGLAGANTLFEPTFGCSPSLGGRGCAFNPADPSPACQSNPNSTNCSAIASSDNVDISAVNAYTMPMTVTVAGQTCSPRQASDASMLDLASCPSESGATLYSTDPTQQSLINQGINLLVTDPTTGNRQACVAPFNWFIPPGLGTPRNTSLSDPRCLTIESSCYYAAVGCDPSQPATRCPGGSGPQQKVGPKLSGEYSIQNTNWVQRLFAMRYSGYTWQYGDGVGDQSCAWGGAVRLELCPNRGTPYVTNTLWTFLPGLGTCRATGTGTQDNKTTFASLFDCQTANMRYTCQDLTALDPYEIPAAMWRADPQATVNSAGMTYAQVLALQQGALQCGNVTRDIPPGPYHNPGGNLTMPECNYLYGTNGAACPATALAGAPAPHPVKFRPDGRGRARNVGTGRATGTVTLRGEFSSPRPVSLHQTTFRLWRLLHEIGGAELVRGTADTQPLPFALAALPGSKPDAAAYQTPPGSRPFVQVQVRRREDDEHEADDRRQGRGDDRDRDGRRRDPRARAMEFSITASRAVVAAPGRCTGAEPTTTLETRFSLHDHRGDPVQVDAKLAWECRDSRLVTRQR